MSKITIWVTDFQLGVSNISHSNLLNLGFLELYLGNTP